MKVKLIIAAVLALLVLSVPFMKDVLMCEFMYFDSKTLDADTSAGIKDVSLRAVRYSMSSLVNEDAENIFRGNALTNAEKHGKRAILIFADTDFINTAEKISDSMYRVTVKIDYPSKTVCYITVERISDKYFVSEFNFE